MAAVAVFLSHVLLFCLVRSYTGHPVQSGSQSQNNNNPALASLMSFTLRLNQLERKLENRQAAIDRQTNAIARFRDDMQSKASKNYLERTADRLRSQITNVRELAEVQRAHAELYINRLYTVTNAFQAVETDFRRAEADMREVKAKFDNLHLICEIRRTKWSYRANGAILYLNRHLVSCGPGELLQKFVLQKRNSFASSMVRYEYFCCKLNF